VLRTFSFVRQSSLRGYIETQHKSIRFQPAVFSGDY